MNAILNITVRVNAQQAQQMLRQQEAQLRGLQAAAGGAGGAMGRMGIGAALGNLNKFGKNLQWTGRQLEYNFTLPLALAGAASTKWALDNEAAMTKVRKVYGDLTMSQKQVREETNALETSFRLLSDRFGVHQDEVINIGALWAQAGASGVALARATKLTLEAMIIGDLGAEEAVTSLIALQAAYKFSTIELKDAMAQLNIVENQTAIGFDGLMDVVTRAAGTARSAGIDLRHLAAMASALVPTTGSASQAGNALRTMISRLMVPTKEASEVMGKMGIDIYDASWQAKNGTERFEAMAVGFNKLTQSQKGVVSAFVASRWQVNRFDILMADITSKTGNYAKALDATNKANKDGAGQVQYLATYVRELNTYLTSTPQRFKILTTQIQNAMASAIMPLLPAMVALLTRISQAANWFANLSPEIQQMALGFLLVLALIGPVIKLFGAVVTLLATLGEAVTWFGTLLLWLGDGFVFIARLPFIAVWNAAVYALAFMGDVILGVITIVQGLGTALMVSIRAFMQLPFVVSMMATVQAKLAAMVAAFGTWLGGVLAGLGPALWSAMQVAGALILTGWSAIWSAVQTFTAAIIPTISALVSAGMTAVSTAFQAASAAMQIAWVAVWNFIAAFTSGFIPTLALIIDLGMMAVRNTFAAVSAGIQLAWVAVWNFIAAFTAGFIPTLGFIIDVGMVAVRRVVGAAVVGIQLMWSAMWSAIGVFTGAFLPTLALIIDLGMMFIRNAFWASVVAIQTMWSALWTGIALFTSGFMPTLALIIDLGMMAVRNAVAALTALPAVMATVTSAWSAGLGVMSAMASGFGAFISSLPALIASSWAILPILLIAAVGVLAWMFPDIFAKIVDSISAQLAKLPGSVISVFRQVVEIVKRAALAVYEWLSYINPFAHHSPSLVEQVNAGVETILSKYSELNGIESNLRGAIGAHRAFLRAVGAISSSLNALELAGKRADVVAVAPGAGGAFDAVVASIKTLYGDLTRLGGAVARQEVVTTRWEASLDKANAKLEAAEAILDKLESRADSLKGALDDARGVLDRLVSTPLQGMGAMNDSIFENEMAQKRLRLEMMKIEDTVGPIDELRDRMSRLQGEIEGVRATQAELRGAGAGSDVLSTYDDQIAALEAQQVAIEDQVAPINALEQQLKELQRQGERLDLEKSLQFDPLTRQIEQITNAVEEIPFDQLLAQIKAQQAEVDRLEGAWNLADAAVTKQKAAVDQLKAARDAVAATYDKEKEKLDGLKDAYASVESQIRDMEQAINDFAGAASAAIAKAKDAAGGGSDAEKLFDAAAAGDFEVPGGDSGIGREGGLADIEQWNKDMEAELEKSMQGLGKIDMFKPLKDMWNSAWEWLKKNTPEDVQEFVLGMKENLSGTLAGAGIGALIGGLILGPFGAVLGAGAGAVLANMIDPKAMDEKIEALKAKWKEVSTWFKEGPIGRAIGAIAGFFGVMWRAVEPIVTTLWNNFKRLGKSIGDELKNWAPLWDDFTRAIGRISIVIAGVVAALWAIAGPVIKNVIRPLFDAIIGVVKGAMEMIRGAVQIVLAIINGDWRSVWEGIKVFVGGIWHAIYGVIKGALGGIMGVVAGLVEGVVNIFQWLYDVLVGHSIIPDLVESIIGWFKFLGQIVSVVWNALWAIVSWAWENVIKPVLGALGAFIKNVLVPVFGFLWDAVQTAWNGISAVIKWAWGSVIQPIIQKIRDFIKEHEFDWLRFKFMVQHVWGQVKQAISDAWNNTIKPALQAIWNFIITVLVPVFNFLWTAVQAAWGFISGAISIAWEVIKVIFEAVKWYIENILIPVFQFLWPIIKAVFGFIVDVISFAWGVIKGIFAAIGWVIENILVPVFKWLWGGVKGAFEGIWNIIKAVWGFVSPIFMAIFNYVKDKLGVGFSNLWNIAKAVFEGVRSAISTAWNFIKPIFEGIRDFITEKLVPKFVSFKDTVIDIFNKVRDAASTVFDKVKSIMKGAINGGISVINTLIKGLNKVADVLPGLDFTISLIPEMAQGGRIGATPTKVGSGMVTSRPRAIVGEGSPVHPEFVIPTDPRYRDRAFALFAQLGGKLGVFAQSIGRKQVQYGPTAEGAPHMAIGGIIPTPSDVVGAVKDSAEWAGDKVREGAAMAAFAPFNVLADNAIKGIPWDYVRDATKGVKNEMYNWVKGTDDGLNKALADLAASLVGSLKTNGTAVLKGVDPKLLSSYAKYNAELGNPFTIISAKRSLAQQEALYQAYLNGTGNLAAKPNPNAPHVRGAALDHAPGTNFAAKYLDVAKKYGMHYPVRSPQAEDWHIQLMRAGGLLPRLDASLENGGSIVGARPGGAILRVGEGGYDERIQVTPVRSTDDGEGKTVNHFHGNLVFPNVTHGEDAEDFIKSLESLGS